MEDEIDIYADLPNFNLGDNENLAEKNKKISEKCTILEEQVAELTQSLESLQKVNNNLEVNLSSLLKTAKAEIARKDRMIADIRRQLDDIQFRRGKYSKSVKQGQRSPHRRKRENSPKERKDVYEVPDIPDTTEFMCSNPPPMIKDDDNIVKKSHQLSGIVNTLFGKRLRKRILDEQEEERKQKEESNRARAEMDSKKTTESLEPEQIAENDAAQIPSKADNLDPKKNKGSSLSSSNTVDSQEDSALLKRTHSNRKRQLEHQAEPAISHKRSKSNNGKSRNCHKDGAAQNGSKNSSKSKTGRGLSVDIPDDPSKDQIIDEHEALVGNDVHNKIESINTAEDDEIQERHNRVAIRLMLLAEGIDPDLEAKKSAKKIVEDKRQSSKKSGESSRSRSKSRNRRRDHRSRSRTPDEHWKNRRGSRQGQDRHMKSRDRFERRKESKNKDGDNLSEFSREICELKERIEHRVDDRAGKGRGLNRHKRNDERSYKSGRSGSPDSSRSGSKEKTDHRSRDDKQYGRSRSRDRHKSLSRGRRQSNFDDVSTKNSKTVVPERERTENLEIVTTKVTENPETKSLLSLEDGEIVDSSNSSPVKAADPVQISMEKILPSNCKLNLLDSDELGSNISEVKCSLPLREIGNSQKNEKPLLIGRLALSIPESNRSTGLNDSLNTSKEERIENIAEFIANFGSDVSESKKKNEKSNEKMIHNDVSDAIEPDAFVLEEKGPKEKIRFILNTVFQSSSEDPLVSPLMENSETVCTKNVNGNNGDEDWCLIAIDSPVKNFEENRKNRIMAQNLQITEKLEPSKIVQTDELSVKIFNDSSETLCVDNSHMKIDSQGEKVTSDKTDTPLAQPIKNTSKTKPAVLTSLRSTYHKGRKEIILSDTNSEQCTKISVPHPMKSTDKSLGCESKTVQQSGDDNKDKSVESKKIEKFDSQNLFLEDVDRNCNNPRKDDEKQSPDDIFGGQNDSVNTAGSKESTIDGQPDVGSVRKADVAIIDRCVDETTKNGKIRGNNSKIEKETATKVDVDLQPDLNSVVKESRSKKSTACKTDLSNISKADMTKSIGSKSKADCNVDKTEENDESSIRRSLENGTKPAKALQSKTKVEGNNSKQKKEPQKLVVFARRRKPVHLEDSSTSSSSVVMNQISFDDTVNDSEKSTNNDIEPSNSLDTKNTEISTENGENKAQKTIA